MNKDIDYVISDNTIIPVDNQNTGCLQRKTQLNNGLHQFLQMKHDLPVST
jgi:preprotein translocase subunit SecA